MTSVQEKDARPESPASRSGWIASHWPALLVGILTLAIAVAIGGVIREREARALEIATATAHAAVLNEVEDRMRDQLGALERLAASWERHGGLGRTEFEAKAEELVRDFSFFQAIEWAAPDFHVRWVVPLAGNEKAEGLALTFEARRRRALEVSRDEHVTTLSRPIELVQGGLGFIVNVPIEVDGRFEGFVLGVCRSDDLMSGLLRNVAPGFAVRIMDDGEILYARGMTDAAWPWVRVAQARRSPRPWSIEVAPRPGVVEIYQTQLPLLVVIAGATLALGYALTMQLADFQRTRNRRLASEMKRRKGAEQELSRVIARIPDHVWSIEVTQTGIEFLYYSSAIERITGRPLGKFRGTSLDGWYETVYEEDLEVLRQAHVDIFEGRHDSFELEYRIYRADGTICWIRERVQSEATARGMRIDGITSDITGTKRAEVERLRSQNERMLLLERERITREMHDGLGGQLVSTIAMLERGRSTPSEIAEALRRALDDMRIVIDSLDPATTDLTTSLGKLRARLESLLRRSGMVLRWRVENGSDLDEFPPEQSLHLLRIIQEAVTNVIMHAKASEVGIDIRVEVSGDDVLVVEIRDDGCGFRPDAVRGGRGISNMMSRAEALSGELRFESGDSGTRIELRVPIPR